MKAANSWIAVQTLTVPGALKLSLHWKLEPLTSPFCLTFCIYSSELRFPLTSQEAPKG